ncbi:hypothetical protein SGPA1_50364 [Streptomyces misionensis JCM 4497]
MDLVRALRQPQRQQVHVVHGHPPHHRRRRHRAEAHEPLRGDGHGGHREGPQPDGQVPPRQRLQGRPARDQLPGHLHPQALPLGGHAR